MRREYRILLAALLGFAVLALGAQWAKTTKPRGDAVSAAALTSNSVTQSAVSPISVVQSGVTPISVTEISEPLMPAVAAVVPAETLAASTGNGCADTGHSAVVDRVNQRAWLCDNGEITDKFVMTSANSQPDPGTYKVYAKDLNASSMFTGKYSKMTHFVAFAKGKYTGARIAFHSIPTYTDGQFVQPLDSVGTPEKHGASSGCIRVLPDDSVKIWDWLAKGDPVTVVS